MYKYVRYIAYQLISHLHTIAHTYICTYIYMCIRKQSKSECNFYSHYGDFSGCGAFMYTHTRILTTSTSFVACPPSSLQIIQPYCHASFIARGHTLTNPTASQRSHPPPSLAQSCAPPLPSPLLSSESLLSVVIAFWL